MRLRSISSKGAGLQMTAAQFKALAGKSAGREHKFHVGAKDKRTADGITFDSRLEKDFYNLLIREFPGIPWCRQVPFLLQEGYKGEDGKKVRAIHMVPDFLLGVSEAPAETGPIPAQAWVVDTKGVLLPDWRIKAKLFGYKFGRKIYTPHSVSDSRKLLMEFSENYARNVKYLHGMRGVDAA